MIWVEIIFMFNMHSQARGHQDVIYQVHNSLNIYRKGGECTFSRTHGATNVR